MPAVGPTAVTAAFWRVRDKIFARLEQMPFGRGLALFGGVAATLIAVGGVGTALGHGSGPGTPVPGAVQSTSRTPTTDPAPDPRSPAPTPSEAPQGSTSTATRIFRVPAAGPPRRPGSRQTAPAGRSPIWRHDPSQWGDRRWFWHWWGGGGRDGR